MSRKKAPPAPEDWQVLDVHKVVDGDTVDLKVRRSIGTLDQFTIYGEGVIRCRPVHLDTPEDDEPRYDEATEDAADWLMGFDPSVDGGLRVTTQGKDSFGRYLSDIYWAYDRSQTLSDYMVREKGWSDYLG